MAIGFDRFTISINNRAVLSGLLQHLGLSDRTVPVLRSLDKLTKIGREKTSRRNVQRRGDQQPHKPTPS